MNESRIRCFSNKNEIQQKQVSCGSTSSKNLVSHGVVPRIFRKHFPEKYKSHSNHDIVLLCRLCKKRISDASCRKKDEILANLKIEFESKFKKHKDNKIEENVSQAFKACTALLKHRLPQEVKQKYDTIVSRYLDVESFSESDLQVLCEKLQAHVKQNRHTKFDLGSIYSKKFLADPSSIRDFVFMWRRFFVETLRPKFLVRGWSVNRPLSGDERD